MEWFIYLRHISVVEWYDIYIHSHVSFQKAKYVTFQGKQPSSSLFSLQEFRHMNHENGDGLW